MIICHPLRLIFIKTKKVAGTSFEIAVSKFCGPDCVITPISAPDEQLRQSLGFRGPQNYLDKGNGGAPIFFNHMTSSQVCEQVGLNLWMDYVKVAIVRNPFDVAISRYYWEGGSNLGLTFLEYVKKNASHIAENSRIAPLEGKYKLDAYCRYEYLKSDLAAIGAENVWEVLSSIRAKANVRPGNTDMSFVYSKYPEAISIVAAMAAPEIEAFGYRPYA